ncbi:hypothetical protein K2173_008298 [Erythroxylum novogranatense]|uniref:BHLH domain-containing protein n=1 Tax=Erythroxylum novogranatense TaxID=1862640 RepID=A0AAV8U7B7_9ROSI|nr:hypothetical protein K2173_008298 [Erythroxylum novogranatense]
MKRLERAVEWLRPLVDTKAWDYCVVWKLGDDPSRFIEWLGCCCNGGGDGGNSAGQYKFDNVKEEKREDEDLAQFCRDIHLKHVVRTKSCEALAKFPAYMPLYSGIHGEVVISNQPKWINNHDSAPDSISSLKLVGTQVLIPVTSGLIELFAARRIEEDQRLVHLIKMKCNITIEQEAMAAKAYFSVGKNDKSEREDDVQKLSNFSHLLCFNPQIRVLPSVTQPAANPSFEGSSSSSNPEHPVSDTHSCHLYPNEKSKQLIHPASGSRKSKYSDHFLSKQGGSFSECNNKIAKPTQKSERLANQSKNLLAERNRRFRIREGFHVLRAIVPKITKMDKASVLGDAIDYICELLKEVNKLQDEFREIEEEEKKGYREKQEALQQNSNTWTFVDKNQCFSYLGGNNKAEMLVEVKEIGSRVFLIKFCSKWKRGGFRRLIEVVNSWELQVLDANMTTFHGNVLAILTVEAAKNDVHPRRMTESLIELTM